MWRKGNPFALLLGMPIGAATVENIMKMPQKIKNGSAFFDPVIPLLRIYRKEPKTLIWKNISIRMFIAVLFTIAEIWKQPKCPSADQWIKQLCDIYTMETTWLQKKKKRKFYLLQQYGWTWRTFMLSKISQSEQDKYRIISLIYRLCWTNWTNRQNRDRLRE